MLLQELTITPQVPTVITAEEDQLAVVDHTAVVVVVAVEDQVAVAVEEDNYF